MNQVYVVGRVARCRKDDRPLEPGEHTWTLVGLFSTRDKAAAACLDCRYSLVPLPLDTTGENIDVETLPGFERPCCTCCVMKRNREAAALN